MNRTIAVVIEHIGSWKTVSITRDNHERKDGGVSERTVVKLIGFMSILVLLGKHQLTHAGDGRAPGSQRTQREYLWHQ